MTFQVHLTLNDFPRNLSNTYLSPRVWCNLYRLCLLGTRVSRHNLVPWVWPAVIYLQAAETISGNVSTETSGQTQTAHDWIQALCCVSEWQQYDNLILCLVHFQLNWLEDAKCDHVEHACEVTRNTRTKRNSVSSPSQHTVFCIIGILTVVGPHTM